MIRFKPLLAVMAFAALAACTHKAGTDAKDSVAQVDGQPVSRNTFEEYVKGVASKPASDLTADERTKLLDNLVRAQVIAADAEKNGSASTNETRAALDLSRLQLLQRANSDAYLKDRKPSDEELHAEYDIQIAQMDKTQYHAAHILVPTEEAAKQIIAQLKAGGDFTKIAKAQTTDAGSRDKGGDLDWVAPSGVVGPFGDALKTMKKGETSAVPVKSQFGYHVIRLLDTREVPAPAFDAVKDRLVQIVQQKKWTAYVDGLVAKAKVTKSP